MAEHYSLSSKLYAEEADEDIVAAELDDELAAVACIGRLHLMSSLSTMSSLFQEVLPRLQASWQENGGITADGSALLKETSLLTKYLGHLLTDEINTDSVRKIPSSIETACQWNDSLINELASVIRGVLSLIEAQASSIAACPSNPRLSPSLARDFVWFLRRWAPSYVFSATISDNPSKLSLFWSGQEAAHQVIEFCMFICQRHFCCWPHIESINESATELLIELAKCNATIRAVMIQSNSFCEIYQTQLCVLRLRQGLTRNEVEAELHREPSLSLSTEMVQAIYSLPSETKSGILAVLLIASGDSTDASRAAFNGCLNVVHDSSLKVMEAAQTDMAAARVMIAGCLDVLRGVVYATSEIAEPERIPRFMNPLLLHLSTLMDYYSADISICESLLCLFRDYAESCALSMSPDERRGLFEASSNLLRKYSEHHCTARVIRARTGKESEEEEEDQAYSDILCALELLINLSSTIDRNPTSSATDVVFYGLQQIVPLMTQGLLSYPSLCTKYFSLVSFMMEKHPGRITIFPFELLDSLLQSLLYGATHHDSKVAKKCLEGLAGLAKAHLQSEIMRGHLSHHPDVLDRCTKHLFVEVIFQQLVWDRLDETSNALLVLLAADLGRFGLIARELEDRTANLDQRGRMHRAFEKLLQQDVIAGALLDGYEGRSNRRRFKDDLEAYTNEVHSFLLVK